MLKKNTGELIIAEVESRSKDWKAFVEMVEMVGFRLLNSGVTLGGRTESNEGKRVGDNKGKYFRMLHFSKAGDNDDLPIRVRHESKNYRKEELK